MDAAVKKRKYSLSEANWQADKAYSRTRVNLVWLSPAFEH